MSEKILQSEKRVGVHLKRTSLNGRHIALLVLLLVAGVTLGYQNRMSYEVGLGEEGDDLYIEGFYEPESNPYDVYRWSGQSGLIRFPGIGIPRAVTLRLRMNGARPEGVPLPRIVLELNGQKLSELTAEGQMKIYEFDVPGTMVGWSGDMELQIDSETFSPVGGDLRELGVMTDWAMIVPRDRGVVVPAPLPLASLVLAATIVCLPLTGKRLRSEVVVLAAIGLPVGAALLFAFHRIQAARWSWQLLLLVGAGYLGFIAWDGIVALRRSLREIRRLTLAILFLALVVQLALLAPQFDDGPNTWTYKNWMWYTNTVSLDKLYLEPWALAQPVYPPVSLYILHLIGRAYQGLGSPIPPPSQEPTPLLSLLIRLPGVICNVLLALAVFLCIQRWKGPRWAHLAMVLFALNPAVILHTTRLGQTDSIHSMFILLAIVCVTTKRPSLGWFLLSLAAAIRPQALLFVPLVLALTWRRSHWRGILNGVLATASTALVVLAPFIHLGTWVKVVEYFSGLARFHPWTTCNALNLWWVLGLGNRFADTTAPWWIPLPISGPLSYRTIGFSLLAMALLFVVWKVSDARDEADMWTTAAYAAFVVFMVPTKVHENYIYTVFPLLAMALFARRSTVVIYGVLSCTWLISNLMLHETAIIDLLDSRRIGMGPYSLWDLGMMLGALANTATLGYWTALLARRKGTDETESAFTRMSLAKRSDTDRS
ncbi:MAG TPA: hypothetical protein VM075_07820 [Anaerolineae bacterium]|nr:hypothetical protein [Anaerolineae bacterium]